MALVGAVLCPVQATALESSVAASDRQFSPPVQTNVVTPILTQIARLDGLADAQGDSGDNFGFAVAIDGDTAVVGVPGKDTSGADAGAALVFVRVGAVWTLQATLVPPAPADGLGFGFSVAVSSDTLIVGTLGDYPSTGEAYVYVRVGQTWSLQATLVTLDAVRGDRFGWSVAVSGDTAVVAAPEANTGFGFRSGAVYLFVRTATSWSEQQKLLPADLAADDRFGASVALDGDTVLVGASQDDTGVGVDAGSAYVFTRAGSVWTQQQKLLPLAAASYDSFGGAVALSAGIAVVGAPAVDTSGFSDAGAAFVFEWSGSSWGQTAMLTQPIPTVGAHYGTSVALSAGVAVLGSGGYYSSTAPVYVFRGSGGTWGLEAALPTAGPTPLSFGAGVAASGGSVLVGAPGAEETGAAFVHAFVAGGWTEQARLSNTGTTRGDAFGSTVVVSGDTMAVGSPNDDTLSGRGSGSVTIFARTGPAWTAIQKLVPEPGDVRQFGRSLALEADLLVVGAGTGSAYGGSVYVFREAGSWQLEQKLGPDPGFNNFGAAVATSGGTVLVGAPFEEVAGAFGAGAAYPYVRQGAAWILQQRLTAPLPLEAARFGAGLALVANTAVIGAPGGPGAITPSKAHVYRRSGGVWTVAQELQGQQPGEHFGNAVAMSGLDLAIGSLGSNYPLVQAGSVYLFQEAAQTYSATQHLNCPVEQPLLCGSSLALSGNNLVVGAPLDVYAGTGVGAAAVFSQSGGQWVPQQLLLPTAPTPSFGIAVALAGTQVVVGASQADGAAHDSGGVFVFAPDTSDLSVTMTASPLVANQGDLVTVSLTLTNAGPAVVSGTAAILALEPGLVFSAPATGACVPSSGGATCSFPALASGASASVEFKAAAVVVGTFTSVATVAGGPSAQATTTVLAASADIALSLGTPTTVGRGQTFDLWIYVRNEGPAAAAAINIDHTTPPGLILVQVGYACSSLPCVIPRIARSDTASILTSYRVPDDYSGADPIVGTATATAANGDPVPGNNSATASTPLFVDDTHLRLYTVSPCRLVDTRDGALGGPAALPPGPALYSAGEGTCRIPFSARALAVNVTATEPTADGFLKLYPSDAAAPLASFVNYRAGQTRSNNGLIGLDASSRFVIEVGQASGTTHVIVDVVGYFQ